MLKLNKEEVQKRVTCNGKKIKLSDFSWDEDTNTFSSYLEGLVLNFVDIDNCTFKTGSSCTFKTGSVCTFKTGSGCTFKTGSSCTFETGSGCTFKTGSDCTFDTGSDCTFKTGSNCTFKTGSRCTFETGLECTFDGCTFDTRSDCTFKTGSECTFDTNHDCTFKTGSDCTFKTGSSCTFKTGSSCTFDTDSGCTFDTDSGCTFKTESDCTFDTGLNCTFKAFRGCTFKTGPECTFKTGSDCTFDTGSNCTFDIFNYGYFKTNLKNNNNVVIIRFNNKYVKVYTIPIIDNKLIKYEQNKETIKDFMETKKIGNSTMTIIKSKRLDDYIIYKAHYTEDYFNNEDNIIFIAQKDKLYAHGKTIEEAIADVKFKFMQTKDIQEHINRIKEVGCVTPTDYRLVTGACREGINRFLESKGLTWENKFTIEEACKLTEEQYGSEKFKEIFN